MMGGSERPRDCARNEELARLTRMYVTRKLVLWARVEEAGAARLAARCRTAGSVLECRKHIGYDCAICHRGCAQSLIHVFRNAGRRCVGVVE